MASKECRHCGGEIDWLGRCQLKRETRQPMPIGLVLFLVILLLVGCATTEVQEEIEIKPKPLAEALRQWSELTGYQFVIPVDCDRPSRQAKGSDARAMLDQLVSGTDATYLWVNERTIAIACPSGP